MGGHSRDRIGVPIGGKHDVLGPGADPDRAVSDTRRMGDHGTRRFQADRAVVDDAVEQVHFRRADELGGAHVGRAIVDLLRRSELDDLPLDHDGDPIGHGHGFGLIVRHIDRGGAEPLLQLDDFRARAGAQCCVEIGQRLVQKKQPRLADQRTRQRHALALAAGELPRLAVEQAVDLHL